MSLSRVLSRRFPHAAFRRVACLTALLAAAACGGKASQAAPGVPVVTGLARRQPMPYSVGATGTVEPLQAVALESQVTGTLIGVNFREGDEVRQGQVLFRIDPRPFAATLAQAEAVLARDQAQQTQAAADAARYEALVEKDYVTSQQVDQARTTLAAATATLAADLAAVETARLNLQYATIRAPIAGRTGGLLVKPGNLVKAGGGALVVINQVEPILVRFAVPSVHLGPIQASRGRALPVQVTVPGAGQALTGTLTFVDNAVDSSTGTILLKASFPNRENGLLPGQFVAATLQLAVEPNALVVPAAAVVSGQQGSFVFVVNRDSTATTHPVTVERIADSLAVLTGGVSPGDRVVTDGQSRLMNGARVEIKEAPADSSRTAS